MSLIVSRRSPLFGFVSSSNERRWISIRWGTSRGFSSREKLLRLTGAALERAKVGDSSEGQRDVGKARNAGGRAQRRATLEISTRTPPTATGVWVARNSASRYSLRAT